jgi:hypothetical protein
VPWEVERKKAGWYGTTLWPEKAEHQRKTNRCKIKVKKQ